MTRQEIELEEDKIKAINSLTNAVNNLSTYMEHLIIELRQSSLSGDIADLKKTIEDANDIIT